jgi:hypothetical protein
VRCSWILVEFCVGFNNRDLYPFLCEQDPKQQARWTCASDDYLVLSAKSSSSEALEIYLLDWLFQHHFERIMVFVFG